MITHEVTSFCQVPKLISERCQVLNLDRRYDSTAILNFWTLAALFNTNTAELSKHVTLSGEVEEIVLIED